jgi:hypothetical protein
MPDRLGIKENDSQLNRAAWRWLKEARQSPDPYSLHLLNLADWGLENEAEGDWPEQERYALREQVNLLFGWKPENVLAWLLSNPEGPEDMKEQESDLLNSLRGASSPLQAASFALNQIWARQVSQNFALQPAASELS